MSTSNKWRIKSARTVYSNKWIAVREYQTVAPTGADALGQQPADDAAQGPIVKAAKLENVVLHEGW